MASPTTVPLWRTRQSCARHRAREPDVGTAGQRTAAPSRARPMPASGQLRYYRTAANSCRTPWQAQLDASTSPSPAAEFRRSARRLPRLTTTPAECRQVRWSGSSGSRTRRSANRRRAPTSIRDCSYVTGFDPVNQRFSYRVNQLFGEPLDYGSDAPSLSAVRTAAWCRVPRFGYPPTSQTSACPRRLPHWGRLRQRHGGNSLRKPKSFAVPSAPIPVTPILALRDSPGPHTRPGFQHRG